jgi:hypothetical protein
MNSTKEDFEAQLKNFVRNFQKQISTKDGQWTIKGFIDVFQNIYTISSDTKIISKVLEIHLFPKMIEFAQKNGYKIVLAEHQNYYPDITFVKTQDESIKFAVDFKTTYRNSNKPFLCNGFTLGSHGKYFTERTSTKNIQFPYGEYSGHFCLGVIYNRADNTTINEAKKHHISDLQSVTSVINDLQFFVAEKWRIASDKSGSGNTANIGSINHINDIINGNGMFAKLGEDWFDDYWMNYNKITLSDGKEATKKISSLQDFVAYRKGDVAKIVLRRKKANQE